MAQQGLGKATRQPIPAPALKNIKQRDEIEWRLALIALARVRLKLVQRSQVRFAPEQARP